MHELKKKKYLLCNLKTRVPTEKSQATENINNSNKRHHRVNGTTFAAHIHTRTLMSERTRAHTNWNGKSDGYYARNRLSRTKVL